MDSALVTAPFGKRRDEARNCPTSVRLQRLSIQSFSSCAPGSGSAMAGVPGDRVLVGRVVLNAPSLTTDDGGGALGTARLTFESGPLATAVFSVGATMAARFCESCGDHGLPSRNSAPSVNCQGGSKSSPSRPAAQTQPRRVNAAARRILSSECPSTV